MIMKTIYPDTRTQLGFRILYPSDFRIVEVTDFPVSMTISFGKFRIAPSTDACLTVNATKENAGLDLTNSERLYCNLIRSFQALVYLKTIPL